MSDSGPISTDLIAGSSSEDCSKSTNEISEDIAHKVILKRSADQGHEEEPPDVAKKRSRGPYDCLNWSDSEEDEVFTPFTQENPPLSPPKVFAKKSVGKRSLVKKSSAKNSSAKNSSAKNSGASKPKKFTSKEKGKGLGMFCIFKNKKCCKCSFDFPVNNL